MAIDPERAAQIIGDLERGIQPVDFDWNFGAHPDVPRLVEARLEPTAKEAREVVFRSECLRDGLSSVGSEGRFPTTEAMLKYVKALQDFGITEATVGIFPGDNRKIDTTIRGLLKRMTLEVPEVRPTILVLATEESLSWFRECHKIHAGLQALAFMGTAPTRLLAQDWSEEFVLDKLGWLVRELAKDAVVIGGSEHTTQTPPGLLAKIIETEVGNGASTFCIADTIGDARPIGAMRIVRYAKQVLDRMGRSAVLIEWHGHNDRENGKGNAMAAIVAGARYIHVVARGRGERAGNTALEGVVADLSQIIREAGETPPWKTNGLMDLLDTYDHTLGIGPPAQGPFSPRSQGTNLGIHADATFRLLELAAFARQSEHKEIARVLEDMSQHIYISPKPADFGGEYRVRVGPLSSPKNVILAYRQIWGEGSAELDDNTVKIVLAFARNQGRELTDDELRSLFGNNS